MVSPLRDKCASGVKMSDLFNKNTTQIYSSACFMEENSKIQVCIYHCYGLAMISVCPQGFVCWEIGPQCGSHEVVGPFTDGT